MPGDSAATRRRILDAAIAEFAEHGIAGARIDRIAAGSGNNKALIYKYFGNKDQLFDAVFDAIVVRTMNDVPIDADDLPGYAGRLWDRYRARPELLRLGDWDALERGGAGMQTRSVRAATAEKTAAIADGQRRGSVDPALPAAALLGILLAVCRTNPLAEDAQAQREAVVTTVQRIVGVSEKN
jgi:AcrR family transcriptional regulator